MFKLNNRSTIARCKICSKLTIKTPERRHWRRSGFFNVNFEHISHIVLVFLLLTLTMLMPAGFGLITSEFSFPTHHTLLSRNASVDIVPFNLLL